MHAFAARLASPPLGLARSGLSISRASALRPSPLQPLRSLSSTRPLRPSQAWQRNALALLRGERTALSRRLRSPRFSSNQSSSKASRQTPDPTPHLGSPEPALTLTQRFKKLSREYGWLALWVYLGLTALDLPICFVAVRTLGVERIGHYEHVVVESIKNVLRIPFPSLWADSELATASVPERTAATAREGPQERGGELEQATDQDSGAGASIWTQLALAYAVHKSLIFIRIPLTAAILPKVAKTLRAWGYNVGQAKPK